MFNRLLNSADFQNLVQTLIVQTVKSMNDQFIENEATRIANNYRKRNK